MKTIDWKKRALRNARKTSKLVDIITCPITEKEIAYASESKMFVFENSGQCTLCKKNYYVTALNIEPEVAASKWPIHYTGEALYCDDCKDLDKEN